MMFPEMTVDHCLKCNICTFACPVASVSDVFLGPKAVGPQANRFYHPNLPLPDDTVTWCSGCGTCSQVCPHGVLVAELNIQTKARFASQSHIPLRDQLISRPDLLGRLGTRFSRVANPLLALRPPRLVLEKFLGIHRSAPMPPFASSTLRERARALCVESPPAKGRSTSAIVAYFHGCSSNYYEPDLGELAIRFLEMLGYDVVLPPQVCCGLPLQSNGIFPAARKHALTNIRYLFPFAQNGIPIVGTSPSCTLSLKHDYQAILGITSEEAMSVSQNTFDIFEFVDFHAKDQISACMFNDFSARALYHPPCQLKSHGIGTPALHVLRRIPELDIVLSESACCGVAGTYGMKSEKYQIAEDVGQTLFAQARTIKADFVISDSETCRWWITRHTGLPAYHPLEVIALAKDEL
jgi:glycerol-3-phosphate dehydrogenase subunit C